MIAIAGPTGSGKSDLALAVAEQFHGEVVNCDSLQIYKYFDIGTAKLPLDDRHGIPHHLLDIAEPDQVFTAGEYSRRARKVLADIAGRDRLPVVAGGTGFYLRALIDGLFEGPERDEHLRARLMARRPGSAHRLLRRFDPAAAARIHPNDVPKTVRALEVCLLTRRRVTDLYAQGRDALRGFRVLKLGLMPDRKELYRRLDDRCKEMFSSGLIEEVRRILTLGFRPPAKPFESHGYRQAIQVLGGELSLDDAIAEAQRNTRNYAKRQITWFRREKDIEWLHGFGSEEEVRSTALARIEQFLKTR